MSIDKNKITTQDELNEPAPMDQVDARVEKEMKELEKKAKEDVGAGCAGAGFGGVGLAGGGL